ncbi:hypothetical protein N7495_007786 [Penicillium taxi]|uniref:uncharacterized protein n=1 Tax=Penicillium taxi TaxID=168475 RepID=UPI00254568B1|nr:uncharacterized protein N7495_007786 [Penicillium taxi]KAJ5887745.1 hypothetical protein N7495_007786 [Penicillium taxi]
MSTVSTIQQAPRHPPLHPINTIDRIIQNHPLTAALRENPLLTESRPHLDAPDVLRGESLLAGTLAGHQKISVPPFIFKDKQNKRCVMIMHLGGNVCSHPGIVHGGLLATLLDESFAWCCTHPFATRVGVTARLSVNYRNPTYANSYIALTSEVVKFEGRKAWLEGRIETLEVDGLPSTLLVEGHALFIEPRESAVSLAPRLDSHEWKYHET